MKVRSLFSGLVAMAVFFLPQSISFSATTPADGASASDSPANNPAPVIVTNVVNPPELQELRAKLDALQRANDLALGRWSALLDQNTALSNVLSNLQQTLDSQKRREAELAEQSRSFSAKIMAGAGAAIFLVFLASYWFQLRCLNRVMEISQQQHALPAPFEPALLEAANTRESKLLEAIKLLEDRIRHLEEPAPIAVAAGSANVAAAAVAKHVANGTSTENGHAMASDVKVIDAAPAGSSDAAESSTATKVSVLLAKGEVLLETERLQEAANSFNEALALEPNNAEAHLKKGIALERLNRLEMALNSYNEALRLNPKRSFAYVYKARVLAALHRYDEALSVYDLALGKNGGAKNSVNGGAGEAHRATKIDL